LGGYSRTYSEKRYQINKSKQQEKHLNRTIKTETKISFHQTIPTEKGGGAQSRSRPVGAHKISILNETFSYPKGANETFEFSNVTYFNGLDKEEKEDVGQDNIHPMTHVTRQLYGRSCHSHVYLFIKYLEDRRSTE
jgi:hypothetical protein